MTEMLGALPPLVQGLLILAVLFIITGIIDAVVTSLAAGRYRRSIRGLLPSVGFPVILLALFAAGHLAYDTMMSARRASDLVITETRLLREAAVLSRSLDPAARAALMAGLKRYTGRVLDQEWGEMHKGTVSPASGGGLLPVIDLMMNGPGDRTPARAEIVSLLKGVAEVRRERLAIAAQPLDIERLELVLFLTLVALVMVALCQSEFDGGRHLALVIYTLVLGVLISITLAYASPFSHPGMVSREPLAALLAQIQ